MEKNWEKNCPAPVYKYEGVYTHRHEGSAVILLTEGGNVVRACKLPDDIVVGVTPMNMLKRLEALDLACQILAETESKGEKVPYSEYLAVLDTIVTPVTPKQEEVKQNDEIEDAMWLSDLGISH